MMKLVNKIRTWGLLEWIAPLSILGFILMVGLIYFGVKPVKPYDYIGIPATVLLTLVGIYFHLPLLQSKSINKR